MTEAATDDGGTRAADYSDETSTFGDRLVLAREAVGMTQRELAHRIGVKLPTLRNWEEDRAEPRANRFSLLAGMLNVSMGWLMSGQGAAPVEQPGDAADHILRSCLKDLHDLRADQARLMDRIGRIERQLGKVIG